MISIKICRKQSKFLLTIHLCFLWLTIPCLVLRNSMLICKVINEWADQWKMSFNYDPSKQAVEIYFFGKSVPTYAPGIILVVVLSLIRNFISILVLLTGNWLLNIIWEIKFQKLIKALGLLLGCVSSSLEIRSWPYIGHLSDPTLIMGMSYMIIQVMLPFHNS